MDHYLCPRILGSGKIVEHNQVPNTIHIFSIAIVDVFCNQDNALQCGAISKKGEVANPCQDISAQK